MLKTFGTVTTLLGAHALGRQCDPTLPQGEGPFYPEKDWDRDNDLTRLNDGDPLAKGQVIEIRGKVTNPDCTPVEDAVVEIWQACESGKYNHSEDPNNLPLDPVFQYWGRMRSRKDGTYQFRTIVPGHYPVGPGRFRPPHIHYKVHANGHQSLTTQMFFNPDSYDDLKLRLTVARLNRLENVSPHLMVLFTKDALNPATKQGTFNLVIRKN